MPRAAVNLVLLGCLGIRISLPTAALDACPFTSQLNGLRSVDDYGESRDNFTAYSNPFEVVTHEYTLESTHIYEKKVKNPGDECPDSFPLDCEHPWASIDVNGDEFPIEGCKFSSGVTGKGVIVGNNDPGSSKKDDDNSIVMIL